MHNAIIYVKETLEITSRCTGVNITKSGEEGIKDFIIRCGGDPDIHDIVFFDDDDKLKHSYYKVELVNGEAVAVIDTVTVQQEKDLKIQDYINKNINYTKIQDYLKANPMLEAMFITIIEQTTNNSLEDIIFIASNKL
jgi:hypothetical protein